MVIVRQGRNRLIRMGVDAVKLQKIGEGENNLFVLMGEVGVLRGGD